VTVTAFGAKQKICRLQDPPQPTIVIGVGYDDTRAVVTVLHCARISVDVSPITNGEAATLKNVPVVVSTLYAKAATLLVYKFPLAAATMSGLALSVTNVFDRTCIELYMLICARAELATMTELTSPVLVSVSVFDWISSCPRLDSVMGPEHEIAVFPDDDVM